MEHSVKENGARLACVGSASCFNSTIRSLPTSINSSLFCHGEQSCAHSNIESIHTINAYGAYSLYGASISSGYLSEKLVVQLFGYQAGFGATINCHTNDLCNIICGASGCQMLYLNCPSNNCNVTASVAQYFPIYSQSDYIHSDLNMFVDMAALSIYYDEQCNLYDTYAFDDAADFLSSNALLQYTSYGAVETTNNPICCRGDNSCSSDREIVQNSPVQDAVVCSAPNSCYPAPITSTGPVLCDGMVSCYVGRIATSNDLYCSGTYSCQMTTITGPTNVYCTGYNACAFNTQIVSAGDINIYLLGFGAMHAGFGQPDIICNANDNCLIYCGGLQSCDGLQVWCYGECDIVCDETTTHCPIVNVTSTPTHIPTSYPTMLPTNIPTILPSVDPTKYPSDLPTSSPSDFPSNVPSDSPITPSPTNPNLLVCGESDTGMYNGGLLSIEVQATFADDGYIEINAALSSFTVTHLQGYTNNVLLGTDGGSGDWNDGKNDVLRLNDVSSGKYKFDIQGSEKGFYVITTECVAYEEDEEDIVYDTTMSPSQAVNNGNDDEVQVNDTNALDSTLTYIVIGVSALVLIVAIVGCTVCFVVKSKQKDAHSINMQMVPAMSPKSMQSEPDFTNGVNKMEQPVVISVNNDTIGKPMKSDFESDSDDANSEHNVYDAPLPTEGDKETNKPETNQREDSQSAEDLYQK